MAGNKYGSDKEVAAATHNFKEDRLLEKTLQTLSLEESYALKLLDLDHKVLKVNHKRLKNRVSRIRSYLNADQIAELKTLEIQGKLLPQYNSLNLSSAVKIAAATKRLKLQSDRQRAKSAFGCRPPATSLMTRPTEVAPMLKRSNSVSGAFADLPNATLDEGKRRGSVDGAVNFSLVPNTPQKTDAPLKMVRAQTAVGFREVKRAKPERAQTAVGYSSHLTAEKEAKAASNGVRPTPQSRGPSKSSGRKFSLLSESSLGSNFAADRFAERRRDMLDDEMLHCIELEDRKKEFFGKVSKYIEQNPVPDEQAQERANSILKTQMSLSESRQGSATKRTRKKPKLALEDQINQLRRNTRVNSWNIGRN